MYKHFGAHSLYMFVVERINNARVSVWLQAPDSTVGTEMWNVNGKV